MSEFRLPDIISEIIFVLWYCSKIIFTNTVIGIDIINPGIPHKYPQNINITSIEITFIENDFPMKTGSITPPLTSEYRSTQAQKSVKYLLHPIQPTQKGRVQ